MTLDGFDILRDYHGRDEDMELVATRTMRKNSGQLEKTGVHATIWDWEERFDRVCHTFSQKLKYSRSGE